MSGRLSSAESIHSPLLGTDARISKDRRRFIVLSVFDFCFVVLLWLICVVSKSGEDVLAKFLSEINIFSPTFVKDSLFDIVLVVCLRMVVLIVCYAVVLISHWLPVALTTGGTTIYLTIKVLFFFSHRTKGGLDVPQYLLVLSAFTVAWVELWFMPFRVLPREREADNMQDRLTVQTSPSLRNSRNGRPADLTFSDEEFRTAAEGSSDDDENVGPGGRRAREAVKRAKLEYIRAALTAEREAKLLLTESLQWRTLKAEDPLVRQSDTGAYFVRQTFACSPEQLWHAVWRDSLQWNDQIVEAREMLKVDEKTVLLYSVSAPAMRGYIASRDFVDVRRVVQDVERQEYTGFFMSVEYHLQPANTNKKIVRGVNGPSIIRVTRCDEGAMLEWVMQTDLKGGLPRRLVQSNMLSFFVTYMQKLHAHLLNSTSNPNLSIS